MLGGELVNVFFPNYSVPVIPSAGYNRIKPMQEAEEVNKNVNETVATPLNPKEEDLPLVKKANAKLEDISISFNKQEEYDYLGQENDIQKLDVQKAVSDMQKDQVLQQYQYFVGSKSNIVSQSNDGIVVAKL